MIFFKKLLKYILGQVLFLIKNIISPNKISKSSIKSVIYSFNKKSKLLKRINNKGFNNIINVIDNSKNTKTTFNYNEMFVCASFNGVPETNAKLIILTSNSASKINTLVSQPDYIFIPLTGFFKHFFTIVKYLFFKVFFFNSFKFWNGFGFLLENKHKRKKEWARKFIPFQFSRINFLNTLYKNNIDFVVLRWFNEINSLESYKEDIDILINTKSLENLYDILDNQIGILPIDIYSSTGEEETSYAGLPYYPVEFATKILNNKELHKDGFFIPNNYYHLISLIYHVVFHKSLSSGLPINEAIQNNIIPKRNFKVLLKQILQDNNESIAELTLESLYLFLKAKGFIPQYDLILKLKGLKKDDWFNFVLKDIRNQYENKYTFVDGISIFLLRENAFNTKNINHMVNSFKDYGFELITHSKIKESNLEKAQKNIRGGKWDKGEYEINAGKPVYYFLVFDSFSKYPQGDYKHLYPNLENEKATKLKLELRFGLNSSHQFSMNSIHSSDDFFEAVFYLEQLGYNINEINKFITYCIKSKKDQSSDKFEVIKNLSRHSSRAKVELIKYKNTFAVKKTYKKDKLKFLEREVWFLNKIAYSSLVPKVLETNNNYAIMEYIDNAKSLDLMNKKMSFKSIIQFRSFFETIYKEGITILDINRSNVLLDKNNNLKFIDFEYAQEYQELPNKIIDIYELGKIQLDKVSVYPLGHESYENAYNLFWKRHVYLTKNQFFKYKNTNILRVLTTTNKFFFDLDFFVKQNFRRFYKLCKKEVKKVFV